MAVAAGIIALMSVGIFYQQSISCKVGEQKVLFRCVALPRVSRGEFTFFPSMGNTDRDRGIEAFRRGKYTEAVAFFKKAVAAARNDPEVLIYYNNALALQRRDPFTLAVVVPVDNDAPTAQEMLRGVAQAQNQFNAKRLNGNGRLLEIVIANDGNKPEKSQQVAQELIKDNSILAVIGHNSSDATRAALAEYEKAGVALISPTSTSTSLTGNNFFRTVPSDAASGEKLADYAKNSLNVSKVVIFYNPGSVYSTSLREAFIKKFEKLGGEIVRDIDLSNPNFNAELEVPRSVFRYQAQAALLFPDKQYTSVALEIARANAELLASPSNQQKRGLKLLGGDALYNFATLNAGETAVEGMILAIPWFTGTSQSQPFSQAAQRQWGGQVSWRTATSFDATQALIAALSPDASRTSVLQKLPEVHLPASETSGDALQLAPDKELQREPMIVRVNGGKFELARQ
jgi:ABC-type branched-subunit amino acid transport system substrate-binding protein